MRADADCLSVRLIRKGEYDEDFERHQNRRDCGSEASQRGRSCKAQNYGYGITKGTSVYVRKVAPLGDPIEVTVRGFELSLRKADASSIIVEG